MIYYRLLPSSSGISSMWLPNRIHYILVDIFSWIGLRTFFSLFLDFDLWRSLGGFLSFNARFGLEYLRFLVVGFFCTSFWKLELFLVSEPKRRNVRATARSEAADWSGATRMCALPLGPNFCAIKSREGRFMRHSGRLSAYRFVIVAVWTRSFFLFFFFLGYTPPPTAPASNATSLTYRLVFCCIFRVFFLSAFHMSPVFRFISENFNVCSCL